MIGNTPQELSLHVGILERARITILLEGSFLVDGSDRTISGQAVASVDPNGVALGTEAGIVVHAKEITLVPVEPRKSTFLLYDVVIGKDFHWQREEHQRFRGSLLLHRVGAVLGAVNIVDLEEYLASVISSEMSAEGPQEFLKAHAITSRSWLLAQLLLSRELKSGGKSRPPSTHREPGQLLRWYDREDHTAFDVCADDHCQRYQGVTKAYTPTVAEAVQTTRGIVLSYDGKVCDARFSKSCGGISELYENAWDPEHHDYLVAIRDAEGTAMPDLTKEEHAVPWIRSLPKSFCSVDDPVLFHRILPLVDQETNHSYRWREEFGQEELSTRIREKTGIDFGEIVTLVPIRRGPSGRIVELSINGTKMSLTIGKELEIRRILSPSHLRSSAFIIDTDGRIGDVPAKFILTGAGWGHGVGLCQIGAGVMGDRGYSAEQILRHYFPGTILGHLSREKGPGPLV